MPSRSITTWYLACALVIAGQAVAADPSSRVEIAGDYRYAAQESEPIEKAQSLACREAWRVAVTQSSLYQEHTASVVESTLLMDLAYELALSHVQDGEIIEQTKRGRTVRCRVRGYLLADETVDVIRRHVAGSPPEGIEQNRALRILSTKEEGDYVIVQFQALKRLDWLTTAYSGTLRESADIMADFYDQTGVLIRTDRHQARLSGVNQVMNPGMRGAVKFTKPLGTRSYRIWLVK